MYSKWFSFGTVSPVNRGMGVLGNHKLPSFTTTWQHLGKGLSTEASCNIFCPFIKGSRRGGVVELYYWAMKPGFLSSKLSGRCRTAVFPFLGKVQTSVKKEEILNSLIVLPILTCCSIGLSAIHSCSPQGFYGRQFIFQRDFKTPGWRGMNSCVLCHLFFQLLSFLNGLLLFGVHAYLLTWLL